MVTVVVSTDDKKVYANWTTTVWPSEARLETTLTENGRIDLPGTSGYSSTIGVGASFQGTADGKAELSNTKKVEGETGFGQGVDVTVSIANGKNGGQLSSNPVVRLGAPAGTIDGSATLRITGKGNVSYVGGETRPFPSYAVYAYTLGADGKPQIVFQRTRSETPPVENLTKPKTQW